MRPEALAVAGYYPFPAPLLPALAALVTLEQSTIASHTLALADPCAGEGQAIAALACSLAERYPAIKSLRVTACEMEAGRFAALRARAWGELGRGPISLTAHHADAFTLVPQGSGEDGAHILLLNPPYGAQRRHGRLEQAWLARFTGTLMPGAGLLLFVVPHAALAASAAHLAVHYEHLSCLRLPDPDFAAYGQVVLLGRRAPTSLAAIRAAAPPPDTVRRILAWGEHPNALSVLGQDPGGAVIPFDRTGSLGFGQARVNLADLLTEVKPWTQGSRATPLADSGLGAGLESLVGRPYPVAMPPKPAHLALALASGAFNGKRIEPDHPASGLPPVLLKGAFTRDYAALTTNLDQQGNPSSQVQVQQPRLSVVALDLRAYRYVTIKEGHIPTGAAALDQLNMGDLLASYGAGLTELMSVQFPPLHQPDAPAHQLALPRLGRALFTAQHQAVQATLKLLGQGVNPFLISEVGTGKTTMALAAAAALAPAVQAATTAELRRVKAPSVPLPRVRRVLVLCPPHLLTSWRQETAAVLPGARAVVLSRIADINQALAEAARPPAPADGTAWDANPGTGMTVYILSREMAKLGHAIAAAPWRRGGEAVCPRCGSPIALPEGQLAARRARCLAQASRPANPVAGLTLDLAALLGPYHPDDERLPDLIEGRLVAALRARHAGRPAGDWADPRHAGRRERLLRRLTSLLIAEGNGAAGQDLGRGLECLLAACPDAERARLGPELGERLHAASGETTPNLREIGLRLLLLSGVEDSPLERAHEDKSGPWRAFRLTRRLLAAAPEQPGAYNPYAYDARPWYGYARDAAGRTQLYDRQIGGSALALAALAHLLEQSRFRHGPSCGEPLYSAVPSPRRYPLAKYLIRQARGLIDLCILDECQEYATAGSAQEKAAHRLVTLPGVPTLSLSGSLINGYSSSLFANMWALSRSFRAEFPREGKSDFVSRYGFRKRLVILDPEGGRERRVAGYGSQSDREEVIEDETVRQLGEAPGVLPLFILRHLLPEAILVHKSDLDLSLPALDEYPVGVGFADAPEDRQLAANYLRLTERLLAAIKADRGTDRAGRLWGAMSELPSYLDLAAADTGNVTLEGGGRGYEIRYPTALEGELIAEADPLPAAYRTPKERWLLATVKRELAEGRNVLLFVRHSGKEGRLPQRLARLLAEDAGIQAAILDAEKVGAAKRQDWINQEVIGRGRRVLIANPQAVKTGLNNLVFYATGIFFELDHSAICYRQAVGRLHRIGQTKAVRIFYPVFDGTAQTTARDLLGQKIKASLQTDGLDIESALEAVGAGDESSRIGARAALSLGQEIYQRLAGQPLPPISFAPVAPRAPVAVPAPPPSRPRSAVPDPDWSGPRTQLSLFA